MQANVFIMLYLNKQNRHNGIHWSLFTQLDDLDFADDVALLSQNHQKMQEKSREVEQKADETGSRDISI